MEPGKLDIRIIRNRTFELNFTAKQKVDGVSTPIDTTGYKAQMQVRDTSEDPDILLDLSTDDGEITLGGVNGEVAILAGADKTKLLLAPDNAVWDLVFIGIATPLVTRLPILEGDVEISTDVTK